MCFRTNSMRRIWCTLGRSLALRPSIWRTSVERSGLKEGGSGGTCSRQQAVVWRDRNAYTWPVRRYSVHTIMDMWTWQGQSAIVRPGFAKALSYICTGHGLPTSASEWLLAVVASIFNYMYLSLEDLVHEGIEAACTEGMLESGHLIHTAAQGPDVRLVVVWLVGEQLRTHIVWRANHRVRQVT